MSELFRLSCGRTGHFHLFISLSLFVSVVLVFVFGYVTIASFSSVFFVRPFHSGYAIFPVIFYVQYLLRFFFISCSFCCCFSNPCKCFIFVPSSFFPSLLGCCCCCPFRFVSFYFYLFIILMSLFNTFSALSFSGSFSIGRCRCRSAIHSFVMVRIFKQKEKNCCYLVPVYCFPTNHI